MNKLFNKKHARHLLAGDFGMEKENIRVTENGELATTDHPKIFGNKLEHPYVTTDFAESQVEMITPVCRSIEDVHNMTINIHDVVQTNIEGELLWPSSIPPSIEDEAIIHVAKYDDTVRGREEEAYRNFLVGKYGKRKQMLSGIHYNYSLRKDVIACLKEELGCSTDEQTFRNTLYLHLSKEFLKSRWLLVYLLGATPVIDDKVFNQQYPHAISIRNSHFGYCNKDKIYLSYENIQDYVKDMKSTLDEGKLNFVKELYSPIRLKTIPFGLETFLEEGVSYVEVRILDINPMEKAGVNIEDLRFIHLFMLYNLLQDCVELTKEHQIIADENMNKVALYGRQENLELKDKDGKSFKLKTEAKRILHEIKEMTEHLTDDMRWIEAIDYQLAKLQDISLLPAEQIARGVEEKGFHQFHLQKAIEFAQESKVTGYRLKGYEDMELSTQILLKGAIRDGISYDILDRLDNFISLEKMGVKQYVKQATKTALDSYTTFLIMENKLVSKIVLEENGVKVPAGNVYTSPSDAQLEYGMYEGKAIVVKPKSTNFGIGITIIKELKEKETYEQAIQMAFSHDDSVLIEEFIKGREYRFLVIGDETVGILHRVPANVIGDGEKSIRELVVEKNKDPLRGKGYRTPLEKIKCGEAEELFLKLQDLDFEYVPKKDEQIFLRENSNISTGGDSIDYTDHMHSAYKDIAVKAAKSAGATICGVDIMIENIKEEPGNHNHAIIEINFNPAIHIHCYPYKGKNRHADEKILALLFPNEE